MSTVFLKVLNMSLNATWLILVVLILRIALKKSPKWISCVLWALVAVRLICPFSFESVFSLLPSSEIIPANIATEQTPKINTGVTVINNAVNPIISKSFEVNEVASVNTLQVVISAAAVIWVCGTIVLLLYAGISYILLKRKVSTAVPLGDKTLECDEIMTPFILGIIRPKIYVPSCVDDETLEMVMAHEKAHLGRFDHWWKPFGFLLLAVYWFNPICWIAYFFLCRDIEAACDEKVIRDKDKGFIAAYSQALLDLSVSRKLISACPVAFGENGVKMRVKGVLNYKKPTFWVVFLAITSCVIVMLCFLTTPISSFTITEDKENGTSEQEDENNESSDMVESEQTYELVHYPEEISDVVSIDVSIGGNVLPPELGLTDGQTYHLRCDNPLIISQILGAIYSGVEEKGQSSCPFDAMMYLSMKDGRGAYIQLATDSCSMYMMDGVCYSYSEESNENFWKLIKEFDMVNEETHVYD
ncbi:MAG: hypothetical protein E7271_11420 [Lachnospiraceae bacterium]|jgi:beta-lactamase regulating signal transducer with metallopeptidase domain|nr:hypothetical protein [Lachnospiraceae bacterium]